MAPWNGLFDRMRPKAYGRRPAVVLLNGLAEQAESWFRNKRFWGRYFDVHMPNVIDYDGDALHARIAADQPVSVDWLVDQYHLYLTHFAQTPPYHLVASSLGGKVAVRFAVRYPELVGRIVLLCPSGMGDVERLPIMEGVRKNDMHSIVRSVFHRPRFVDRDIVKYYKQMMASRKWKTGLLRTIRGTTDEVVRADLPRVKAATLLVTGEHDQVCDPKVAAEAARDLPAGHFLSVPGCGHAPQVEKHWLINRLVVHFLTAAKPTAHPGWTRLLLSKPHRVSK